MKSGGGDPNPSSSFPREPTCASNVAGLKRKFIPDIYFPLPAILHDGDRGI